MNPLYILAVIAVLVVGNYVNKHWRKWWYRNDLTFPSAPKRTDLYYGYYGCLDEQVAETKGHINLHMESQFSGIPKTIQNMLDANADCMLDVSYQVFSEYTPGQYRTVHPDATDRLHDFFRTLQDADVLKQVKIIYPIDEPNNTVGSQDELTKAVGIIRTVAARFPELAGYKLAVIYAADKPFIGQDLYDWVGFDDYDMKSHVLVGKQYKALKDSLHPFQKTIVIPGGAYGQDPKPFIDFAQGNPEVAMVMPFLWFDDRGGSVGASGIRSNGMAAKYIAAGMSVV